ncbi:MAG: NAD(+)/NADH kinase [Deltaproteobacteria bacterium]|nr:NAD(+)/NADH kinase [Deltaproteobacteria bacterium]
MHRVVNSNARASALADALDAGGPIVGLGDEVVLVLGGDGTMLHAIHDHPGARTFIGLNVGYLGFLMNDLPAENAAAHVREHLQAGRWVAHRFPRLRMRADTTAGVVEGLAVNDVYVERQSGTTVQLRAWIDGHQLASRLVCDGLIAATPVGSTAYSYSAGGAASHPLMRSVHLTAICPHAPRLAPIVLPASAKIAIEVLDPGRRPARAVVDGRAHGDVLRVEIASDPRDDVSLGYFDDHDFTATLLRKVLRR